MRVHKVELRTADEPTEPDKRFQLTIESQAQRMHFGAERPERRRPVSVPAQIAHSHGHPGRALVPDEVEEVILGAAAVDSGNHVQDVEVRRTHGLL
jgi:hypothetical protein